MVAREKIRSCRAGRGGRGKVLTTAIPAEAAFSIGGGIEHCCSAMRVNHLS